MQPTSFLGSGGPLTVCVWVSCSQREKGSGGHLLHVSRQCSTWLRGYRAHSYQPAVGTRTSPSWRTPSEPARRQLEEALRSERETRGRKRDEEERGSRKWQCLWSGKPLARLPTPWGRTGGGTRLQPQRSVLSLSPMTPSIRLMCWGNNTESNSIQILYIVCLPLYRRLDRKRGNEW